MLSSGLSGIRAYGPGAAAFAVIALLAGVLIERRVLAPRPMDAIPQIFAETGPLGLRRIVLDPCTGLEKAEVRARTAKAD